MLSSSLRLGLPRYSFSSVFTTNILHEFHISCVLYAPPVSLSLI